MIPLLFSILPAFLSVQSPGPAPAPAPAPAPPPAQGAPASKVAWSAKDYLSLVKDAREQSRILMIFFKSDQNAISKALLDEVFSDDLAAEDLKDMICLQVDVTKEQGFASQHNAQSPPVLVFFNPDGTPRDRISVFKDIKVIRAELSRIKNDIGTIGELRKKVDAEGSDLEARYELYKRLKEFGNLQGSSEQKAAIIKLDPQGTSRGSHHFAYDRITSDIERYWEINGKLSMPKIAELQAYVEMETFPEIIWDGWMRLANTHAYLATDSASKGKFADAKDHRTTRRKFLSYAWRGMPMDPDYLKEWCSAYGDLFWNERDELTDEDKEFLMTMSTRFLEVFSRDAAPHDLRARALFVSGKRVEAIDAAKKSVELEPGNQVYAERLKLFRG